uniref:tetratricopeptide repeat protein n=1 Tax=Flavobacterium sp. TaxID=239 RepID=UPI00404B9BC6
MKNIFLALILALPIFTFSQKLTGEEVALLCIEALEDFESSPLKLHEKDKNILVSKPDCNLKSLPKKVGKSNIEWFCFDKDLVSQLNGSIEKNNGRSLILISHKKVSTDSVSVRIDQWTLFFDKKGMGFARIDKKIHPEYSNKNHDYLFVKFGFKWTLVQKVNQAYQPTEKEIEIEELFQKGNTLHRQGKYQEALEYVEKSMAMDSSFYQRYSFRAKIKIKLGMYESAISDITKCIEKCDVEKKDRFVSSYYIDRANVHLLNNDNESALKDLNQSIVLDSENWKAYFSRASFFISLEEYQKALDDLNKMIRLNDKVPNAYHYRGLAYKKLGKKNAACADFEMAINMGFEESKSLFVENCQ